MTPDIEYQESKPVRQLGFLSHLSKTEIAIRFCSGFAYLVLSLLVFSVQNGMLVSPLPYPILIAVTTTPLVMLIGFKQDTIIKNILQGLVAVMATLVLVLVTLWGFHVGNLIFSDATPVSRGIVKSYSKADMAGHDIQIDLHTARLDGRPERRVIYHSDLENASIYDIIYTGNDFKEFRLLDTVKASYKDNGVLCLGEGPELCGMLDREYGSFVLNGNVIGGVSKVGLEKILDLNGLVTNAQDKIVSNSTNLAHDENMPKQDIGEALAVLKIGKPYPLVGMDDIAGTNTIYPSRYDEFRLKDHDIRLELYTKRSDNRPDRTLILHTDKTASLYKMVYWNGQTTRNGFELQVQDTLLESKLTWTISQQTICVASGEDKLCLLINPQDGNLYMNGHIVGLTTGLTEKNEHWREEAITNRYQASSQPTQLHYLEVKQPITVAQDPKIALKVLGFSN